MTDQATLDPDKYDAIEVNAVREYEGMCEPIVTDNVVPSFFTVYLRLIGGEVEAYLDLPSAAQAMDAAKDLSARYGWPISYVGPLVLPST